MRCPSSLVCHPCPLPLPPQVKSAQFKLDWERVVAKTRFKKLVGREDAALRTKKNSDIISTELKRELDEIRDVLEERKDIIRRCERIP